MNEQDKMEYIHQIDQLQESNRRMFAELTQQAARITELQAQLEDACNREVDLMNTIHEIETELMTYKPTNAQILAQVNAALEAVQA